MVEAEACLGGRGGDGLAQSGDVLPVVALAAQARVLPGLRIAPRALGRAAAAAAATPEARL